MLTSITRYYIKSDIIIEAFIMIFVSIIVPRIISSTDGYVCAASKILEEPSFKDFFLKN